MIKNLLLFLIALPSIAFSQDTLKSEYTSDHLIINKLSEHAYQHISYLYFDAYGKVPCNGMVVIRDGEAVVFDTPSEDRASRELIKWLEEVQQCKITAVVPTHFHLDCLGGLGIFHEKGIPSYAHQLSIKLAKEDKRVLPQHGFTPMKELAIGDEKVIVEFFGAGHTYDNVIAYYPEDEVVFGGCLIKSKGAGKGNLEDANVEKWPATLEKLKTKYANVQTVIPGHGDPGGMELYDYTIQLFSNP